MPFCALSFPPLGWSGRAAPCMDGRWGTEAAAAYGWLLHGRKHSLARMLKTLHHAQHPTAGTEWTSSRDLAWDDFRLVKAIADAKGLPAAAERLGVNHSTVFRRLGQIEDALGVALFERHRRLRADHGGRGNGGPGGALDEDDHRCFTRKLAGRELSPAGELRVTTSDTLLVHLLTPLFAALPRPLPGRAARHRPQQPAAQPVEARRRCGHPGHRQPAGDAGRPPGRPHRLGALWRRRRLPGAGAVRPRQPCSSAAG